MANTTQKAEQGRNQGKQEATENPQGKSAEKSAENSTENIVWLASYPRSGNTLLRTILWHCFGAPSASIYDEDLGKNGDLVDMAGHLEHRPGRQLWFPKEHIPLIKTHELPPDDKKAIYIIRDGREACVSLWKFYNGKMSMEETIAGQHRFGTWAAHIAAWNPDVRPNTLAIRYEDMLHERQKVLSSISGFLNLEIKGSEIPDREAMAKAGGKWVKKKSSWRAQLFGPTLKHFNQVNKQTMKSLGY